MAEFKYCYVFSVIQADGVFRKALTYPVLGEIPTYGDTDEREVVKNEIGQPRHEVMCHLLSLL